MTTDQPSVSPRRVRAVPHPGEAPLPPDLGEHRAREVLGTRFPFDTEDVRLCVLRAARDETPLYPLSTGRNWGMGSRRPVVDGCTVLDLREMRTIRTLDLKRGYAVVEPGVTQRRLAAVLEGTPWMLNVTAGCADTGLVGNTLERGDGTIRARVDDLLGLEVVLGTGEVMTTGGLDRHGRRPGAVAGPDLTRAFLQGNLGVVTAMAISLIPRPETIALVHATIARSFLDDALRALVRVARTRVATHGMLRIKDLWVVPAAGRAAVPETADPDSVTIQVPLLGSREAVRTAENGIRDELADCDGLTSFRSLDTADATPDDPLYPRALFACGVPSCLNLQRGLRVGECALADEAPVAWLMFLPVVPLDPESLAAAVELFRTEAERHGTAAMIEFNVISPHSTNMVCQIPFLREPQAIERAHALRDAVRHAFLRAGFPPYRSNIDHEPRELADRADDYQDGPVDLLKRWCDPAGIIAPGRYLSAPRWTP